MTDFNSWLSSVYSDGSLFFVSNPNPKKGDKISVSMQMIQNDSVTGVFLRGKFNGIGLLLPMTCKKENGLFIYSAEVQVWEKEFQYQFYITTKEKIYYYNEAGITTYIPDEAHNFRLLVDYQMPQWVKNSVFYQIFPERFCNGNKDNDVKDGEYVFDGWKTQQIKNWNQTPARYAQSHCLDFYGGDLEGVRQKIPYLKELGVTCLYLNPIFYGATVHKYDCLDYFNVDPHFGGNKALEELCTELHKNGMKIILDVSINHTGTANRWFNKEGIFFPKTEGAYNNPESEEREYYFFKDDNSYKAWFDVPTLPTLNYTSQKLRNRLYRNKDSLVKKWLLPPYRIDGWRFDVADVMARNDKIQLHHEVWPEIRNSIKEENPEGYILCEDWSDCNEFLNGNEWDSPMNYFGSARPIRQFFGEQDLINQRHKELSSIPYKMTACDLKNRISEYFSRLPYQIRQVQFNLLDSHDVPRLHNNPAISEENYKGAVILLFTLPGAPNVYYGDEAKIDGRTEDNEGCRYPMPWSSDFIEKPRWKLYQKLNQLKTRSQTLSDGGFKILWSKDYVFAMARFTRQQLILSICSADSENRTIQISLKDFGCEILKKTEKLVENSDTISDFFESPVKAVLKDGILSLEIPAGKSYLLTIG